MIKEIKDKNYQEQEEAVMEKYCKDFHMKEGGDYLYITTNGNEGKLFFAGCVEDIYFLDSYVEVGGRMYSAKKGDKFLFIMKNSSKYGIKLNANCFTYNRKKECQIDAMLVYAQSKTRSFLFFFDGRRNLFPIIMFESDNKQIEIPERLEHKFRAQEMDDVTNVYHLILGTGIEDTGKEVCINVPREGNGGIETIWQ